jgi:hypothetical protein
MTGGDVVEVEDVEVEDVDDEEVDVDDVVELVCAPAATGSIRTTAITITAVCRRRMPPPLVRSMCGRPRHR